MEIKMLTFPTTSNTTLECKPPSVLERTIATPEFEKMVCLKIVLREIFYRIQQKRLLAAGSVNVKCFLIGKLLISAKARVDLIKRKLKYI